VLKLKLWKRFGVSLNLAGATLIDGLYEGGLRLERTLLVKDL